MSGWRSKLLPLATETTAFPPPGRRASFLRLGIVALAIAAVWAVVFAPFAFGDRVLLFKAIGSDSLNQEYPIAIHLSDYLRTNGFPRWSFQFGIGQSIYPLAPYLLFNPVAWLPRDLIAVALPWQFLLKLTIAGLLFFRFLQLRGLDFRSSLAGALLAAYSTYMCFGCCWPGMGNEFLAFAFLLVAIETAFAKGRWVYVPCAVALAGFLTVFHLYLSAVLLAVYVPARIVAEHGWRVRPLLRLGLPLAGAALLGCGLAAIFAVSSADMILDSPRAPSHGSRMWVLLAHPVLGVESLRHFFTWAARWLSADLIGTDVSFRGWYNYLEAPINYWGLVTLLLAPQALVQARGRRRILGALFCAYVLLPVLFPWLRYAFWAFQGDYYRTYSLFAGFGMLLLATTALHRYGREGKLNLVLLVATVVALLAVLWFPDPRARAMVVPSVRNAATAYLIAYAAVLGTGRALRQYSAAGWLIVALTAVELAHFEHTSLAGCETMTKAELKARVGYNDYTVDAVREIKRTDPSFYRISKAYSSGPAVHESLNDQMVFGYFGTGGEYTSFNDMDYLRFLAGLDMIAAETREIDTRWAPSLWNRTNVATFAGEKYFLTRDPGMLAHDRMYEPVGRFGDVYAFRNMWSMPFGVSLPRFIRQSELNRWPASAKEHALFYAVLLPDADPQLERDLAHVGLRPMTLADLTRLVREQPLEQATAQHRATGLVIRSFDQNHLTGTVEAPWDAVLVFQTAFDRGWQVWVDGQRMPTFRADFGLIGAPIRAGHHEVRMRFVPAWAGPSMIVTLISAAGLAMAARRWPRLRPASAKIAAAERDFVTAAT